MPQREPLLSDDKLDAMAQEAMRGIQPDANPMFVYSIAAMEIRDHYESLIASDKLRVVEEVDVVRCSDDPWWGCVGCGTEYVNADFNPFCPGCGNPIKR